MGRARRSLSAVIPIDKSANDRFGFNQEEKKNGKLMRHSPATEISEYCLQTVNANYLIELAGQLDRKLDYGHSLLRVCG